MPKSRFSEELIIEWIRDRRAGVSTQKIADRYDDVAAAAVRVATDRVLKADIAESGERESIVRGAYW